jgi:hypothetical protein
MSFSNSFILSQCPFFGEVTRTWEMFMALLYGTLNVLQLISDGCHVGLNCLYNFITVFWCNSLKNKTESLKSKWAVRTEYTLNWTEWRTEFLALW